MNALQIILNILLIIASLVMIVTVRRHGRHLWQH